MLPLADVESSESILLLTESYNRSYGLQQLMSEFGKYFTSHTELQQKLGSQQLMLVVAFAEGQSLVKYFTSHSALQQKLQIAIVDACR